MSSLLRDSLKEEKEAVCRKVDYFICYLCTARGVMGDSEQLIFHNVFDAEKHDRKMVFSRNEVVLYETPCDPYKYLMRVWSGGFSKTGFEKALIDIEKSPINGRITPEMVTERYNEYKGLLTRYASVKMAREKFLKGLGTQH